MRCIHATMCIFSMQSLIMENGPQILPVRHLLVLRCLLFKNRDAYAWDKLMELEVKDELATFIKTIKTFCWSNSVEG